VVVRYPDFNHAFNGFMTDGHMTYVDAGDGVVGIAPQGNDGLIITKTRYNATGAYTSTRTLGQESDFEVFWC
jgi:hypothetical protein